MLQLHRIPQMSKLKAFIKKQFNNISRWKRRFCCCDHQTEIKIFITIFGLINLGIMASGGVGFGLGLSNNHREETFKYLMVNLNVLTINVESLFQRKYFF